MISGVELHSNFNTSSNMMDSNRMRGPPMGVRDVVINRPTSEMSFGFVLQSNTKRRGCSICEYHNLGEICILHCWIRSDDT